MYSEQMDPGDIGPRVSYMLSFSPPIPLIRHQPQALERGGHLPGGALAMRCLKTQQ